MIALLLLALPAAQAVEREKALDNAVSYAVHTWTMTDANRFADCDSSYESTQSNGGKVGLPYGWAGYDTLSQFDAGIAAGEGAGAHSDEGYLSCIAGVDCSGYVSRVWETSHYSTSTFYSVTSDISASSLKRADALNKAGSHIVLYTYETAAGVPVFYEASGGGDKVRINSSSSWSYVSSYQPVRFDGISDGPTSGTTAAPREIPAFPFEDLRWTAGAASDVLDGYSCSPSSDESGPEVIYHFTAPNTGTVKVSLSDDSGVDIDIHVLSALSADACLARDDTDITVAVPAGDIYIVADTYVGSREYPGPYLIQIDYTADAAAPDPDPEPVDTGDPAAQDDVPVDTATPPAPEEADPPAAVVFGPRPKGAPPGRMFSFDHTAGGGCATGGPLGGSALLGLFALLGRRRSRG